MFALFQLNMVALMSMVLFQALDDAEALAEALLSDELQRICSMSVLSDICFGSASKACCATPRRM